MRINLSVRLFCLLLCGLFCFQYLNGEDSLAQDIERLEKTVMESMKQLPTENWFHASLSRWRQSHEDQINDLRMELRATAKANGMRQYIAIFFSFAAALLAACALVVVWVRGRTDTDAVGEVSPVGSFAASSCPPDYTHTLNQIVERLGFWGDALGVVKNDLRESLVRFEQNQATNAAGNAQKQEQVLQSIAGLKSSLPLAGDNTKAGAFTGDLPGALCVLLPEPFRDGAGLSLWRRYLVTQSLKSPLAADVLSALLELQAVINARETTLAKLSAVLFRFSEKAYEWWYSMSPNHYCATLEADGSEGDQPTTPGEVNAQWLAAIKQLCASRWPDLEIHAFYPDSRLDADLMVKQDEQSGMRLTVSRPLSWALTEKTTGGKPRVLYRARVVTN